VAKEDLIPQSERTKEEQKAIARMGGIASGKARREKKKMRETLEMLLSMPLNNKKAVDVEDVRSFAALKGKNISVQDAMLIAQVQKAMKGDTQAAVYVRDTIGQKPVDNVDMNMNVPVFFQGEDELEE